MMDTLALALVRSPVIHVGPVGIHVPDGGCNDTCAPYWRALSSMEFQTHEFQSVLTVLACNDNADTRHSRAFVGEATLDICSGCIVEQFFPVHKTLHVLAWSRADELALVERVGADVWTPFTDDDARNMLKGTRSRLTVALDGSDEAFDSITPSMMRLVVAGRLHFVICERS